MASSDQFAKSAWMMASIAVVVGALYLAKGLLVPLTLAVLLSFLLSPLCDRLERLKLGRIPAVMVTAGLGFALLGIVMWTAAVQMTDLAPKIPEYQGNIQAKLQAVNNYFVTALNRVARTADDLGQQAPPAVPVEGPQGSDAWPYSVRVLASPVSPLQILGGTFGTLIQVLGVTGIVIVLVVFFLIRREDLRDRFIRLVGKGQLTVTTQMLEDAATRVSRYLSMLFLINTTFGIAVGIGLYLIGVPNAILWGILATTLRFIPYIGPWIAAAMPVGLSMAVSTGWGPPALTVALFVTLELFSNNLMEPWLYGKNTGMSAVAVLVAAVFWTWLWGISGLLLATPLTVCLMVIGKHVPQLSFLDILLGNEPVFEPMKRVYQRLLAGDPEEAAELVEAGLEKSPLIEVYDSLLLPTLALVESDWHCGDLDAVRHEFVLQSLKEMISEQDEHPTELAGKDKTEAADSPSHCLLCLPARDEADAIAGMMLAQLLADQGCVVQSVASGATVGDLVDLVERRQAIAVCVSSTPPAAVTYARRLCRQLRARMPQVPIIVGLWNTPGDLSKTRVRIGGGDNTYVVASLAQAQAQVLLLLQPLLPPSVQPIPPVDGPPAMEATLIGSDKC
jgi:predicted PurR-regulated permease PerM/CheY-like chemotaxis protein